MARTVPEIKKATARKAGSILLFYCRASPRFPARPTSRNRRAAEKESLPIPKTVAQAVDDRDRNRYERKTADVL